MSHLGAEKFFDIKCRLAGLTPDVAVIVATLRALKTHGGLSGEELTTPNHRALEAGIPNLEKHVENMLSFGLPVVVVINAFHTDTPEELDLVRKSCSRLGVPVTTAEIWSRGGEGGIETARTDNSVDGQEHVIKSQEEFVKYYKFEQESPYEK